jgi:hypothetical protein
VIAYYDGQLGQVAAEGEFDARTRKGRGAVVPKGADRDLRKIQKKYDRSQYDVENAGTQTEKIETKLRSS